MSASTDKITDKGTGELTIAYIGLGANLGDPRLAVGQAFLALKKMPRTVLTGQSALFISAPVDAAGPDFVNAVARIETGLSAGDLLEALQKIELHAGRERIYRNAPRTLDLDILLYGDQQIKRERLEIPHPRLTQRAFTLIPLLQLDPFISIPGLGPAHAFVSGVADQQIRKL